jgi:ubiquinone biosynthesis protein UbiJ
MARMNSLSRKELLDEMASKLDQITIERCNTRLYYAQTLTQAEKIAAQEAEIAAQAEEINCLQAEVATLVNNQPS